MFILHVGQSGLMVHAIVKTFIRLHATPRNITMATTPSTTAGAIYKRFSYEVCDKCRPIPLGHSGMRCRLRVADKRGKVIPCVPHAIAPEFYLCVIFLLKNLHYFLRPEPVPKSKKTSTVDDLQITTSSYYEFR